MYKAILACAILFLSQMQVCLGTCNQLDWNQEARECRKVYSKHYVPTHEIELNEDGIWIISENRCLHSSSLFYDPEGFYYLEEEGVYWICSNCGALNSLENSSCYRCKES